MLIHKIISLMGRAEEKVVCQKILEKMGLKGYQVLGMFYMINYDFSLMFWFLIDCKYLHYKALKV